MGHNRDRNHPRSIDVYEHCSTHAEEAAIKAVKSSLVGAVLYVARINNANQPLLSYPCERCWELILAAGIHRVVYT